MLNEPGTRPVRRPTCDQRKPQPRQDRASARAGRGVGSSCTRSPRGGDGVDDQGHGGIPVRPLARQLWNDRLPKLLREAELRGDRFEITDLRIRLSHALALATDDPVRASSELREAVARWRTGGFDIQHWWALIGSTEIDLYAGRADLAWARMMREWPSLRSSLFLLVQYIRIESLQHRARAALALASSGTVRQEDERRLLRRTRRDAARMQRDDAPWGKALAVLLRAGVAAHERQMDEAGRLLYTSEAACRACDMELYAVAAQRMRGVLQGGSAGRDLIASADRWMRGQDIRNPERMAAMLVPGFARMTRIEAS